MSKPTPRTSSFEPDFQSVLADTLKETTDCLCSLDAFWKAADKKGERGASLAAAALAVNHIHHAWSSFAGVDQWLARLARDLAYEEQLLHTADQIRVHCAATVAQHLSDSPFINTIHSRARLKRVIALLTEHGSELSVDELFSAARSLLDLIEVENQPEGFEAIMLLLEARRSDAALNPLWLGRALVYGGRCYLRFNLDQKRQRFRERALRAWREAHELGRKHKLSPLLFDVAHAEILDASTRGEIDALPLLLADMELALDTRRPMQLSEYFVQRAKLALYEEDVQTAATASADAARYARLAHAPERQVGPHVLAQVWSLALGARYAAAREMLAANIASQAGRPKQILLCIDAFLCALAARDTDGPDTPRHRSFLADAIKQAVELQWPNYLSSLPKLSSLVSADALNANIEPAFVRAIIAQRKLPPPMIECPAWPWPIEITTFGGFTLKRYGERVEFQGKVQKKPLELLKCVAAAGPRGVSIPLLSEILWPDAEPERARTTFKVTLSRLRNLLGVANAMNLTDTRVALNREIVRADCEQFDALAGAIESVTFGNPPNVVDKSATAPLGRLAERVLSVYAGGFLGDEPCNRWLQSSRVRWHARFIRVIAQTGLLIEAEDGVEAAIRLYERAAERDATAEELHRRLIAAYIQQGEHAQAMSVFLRLRHNLALLLGVMPSEKTLALIAPLNPVAEGRVATPGARGTLRLN